MNGATGCSYSTDDGGISPAGLRASTVAALFGIMIAAVTAVGALGQTNGVMASVAGVSVFLTSAASAVVVRKVTHSRSAAVMFGVLGVAAAPLIITAFFTALPNWIVAFAWIMLAATGGVWMWVFASVLRHMRRVFEHGHTGGVGE